jgi:hypothetical protein
MNDLLNYIQNTMGFDVELNPLEKNDIKGLPLFVKSGYNIYEAIIFNHKALMLESINEDYQTPDALSKQKNYIEQKTGVPIIFVFKRLESYNLKRYIQKRINFIVPGKQIYLPNLMLDLKKAQGIPVKKNDFLTPIAQFILLYHIQVESLDRLTSKNISEKFKYSYITTKRALNNLKDFGLCSFDGKKEKQIIFLKDNKNLWYKALPCLRSPVDKVLYSDEIPDKQPICKSNINALAHYSNLNDTSKIYIAIYKDDIKNITAGVNKNYGFHTIEIWRYNPAPMAKEGFVDCLSLFLILQNNSDERIQIELEKMLEGFKW